MIKEVLRIFENASWDFSNRLESIFADQGQFYAMETADEFMEYYSRAEDRTVELLKRTYPEEEDGLYGYAETEQQLPEKVDEQELIFSIIYYFYLDWYDLEIKQKYGKLAARILSDITETAIVDALTLYFEYDDTASDILFWRGFFDNNKLSFNQFKTIINVLRWK